MTDARTYEEGRRDGLEEAETICHNYGVDQRIHKLAAKGAWDCMNKIRALKTTPADAADGQAFGSGRPRKDEHGT